MASSFTKVSFSFSIVGNAESVRYYQKNTQKAWCEGIILKTRSLHYTWTNYCAVESSYQTHVNCTNWASHDWTWLLQFYV